VERATSCLRSPSIPLTPRTAQGVTVMTNMHRAAADVEARRNRGVVVASMTKLPRSTTGFSLASEAFDGGQRGARTCHTREQGQGPRAQHGGTAGARGGEHLVQAVGGGFGSRAVPPVPPLPLTSLCAGDPPAQFGGGTLTRLMALAGSSVRSGSMDINALG